MCLLGSKVEPKPLNSSTRLRDRSKLANSGQGPPNVLELLFFGQCTLNYNKDHLTNQKMQIMQHVEILAWNHSGKIPTWNQIV